MGALRPVPKGVLEKIGGPWVNPSPAPRLNLVVHPALDPLDGEDFVP